MARLLNGAPTLTVEYGAPTEQGVGPAESLHGFSMLMSSDRDAFEGAALVFELPNGRAWRDDDLVNAVGTGPNGKTTMVMAMGDLTASAHADLFADVDAMGRARLSLRRGQQVIKAGTWDLADRATRDRLFREAWGKAVEAAKKPKRCKEAN